MKFEKPQANAARRREWPLWLRDAKAGEDDQLPLKEATTADVTIVGGGYVGLWTALELRRRDPGCDVVLIEKDVCGAGASGRNGGQLHSWWDRVATLAAVCGEAEAVRLANASVDAIETIAGLKHQHGLDVGFRRDGWIWTASTRAQLGAWDNTLGECERRGASPYRVLDSDEVSARTGSAALLGGIVEATAGTVHPGLLVRGLRRLALQAGVRIYEHTPLVSLDRGSPPVARCADGEIQSRRIVLAMNAWTGRMKELRSQLLVVSSVVIATAPVPTRLAEVGWQGGAAICDSQARVLYYQATADGRIVFGRGGGQPPRTVTASRRAKDDQRWVTDVVCSFRRLYPELADVDIAEDWSRPVDRSFTHLPLFGHLGGHPDILYGVGWSGTGVGPAVLGGRILSALALDIEDEWSNSALVDQPTFGRYPPEPLRSLGGVIVRRAVMAQAKAEEKDRPPNPLTKRIATMVPGMRT